MHLSLKTCIITVFNILIFQHAMAAPKALAVQSYPGLPTRSQNPVLQSYFIPAMPVTSTRDWSFSYSFYLTNTYQTDKNSSEELIIDVENTRHDFQMTYTQELWHFNINLSLISNSEGFMDQTIQSWHDFLGVPQGGRDQTLNDQIRLFYQKDGAVIFDSQQAEDAIGDIQLAAGYQLSDHSQIWFAVELPASSSSEFISNNALDLAFWYNSVNERKSALTTYTSVGIALPADSGLFENRLNNQFLFAQLGLLYPLTSKYQLILQSDYHSPLVKNSELDALDHSLQAQFVLRLPRLMKHYQLDLFFSEDIFPGYAPDITFGLRFSPSTP